MFFDQVVGSIPTGQVEVCIDEIEDGAIDVGWDLLTDITPQKWQELPSDFETVKRDWARWYLDEAATSLDTRTLLAMYVLADNDLPYEADADYAKKLSELIAWLRTALAEKAAFDVKLRAATVGDVAAALRRYLVGLPAPAPRTLSMVEQGEDEDEDQDGPPWSPVIGNGSD